MTGGEPRPAETNEAASTEANSSSNVGTVLGTVLGTRRRRRDVDHDSDAPAGRRTLADVVVAYGVVIFLAIMLIGFSVWLPDSFPNWSNFKSIINDQAIPGILALAVVIPLAAGEFDLSVGATLGFASVISAYASTHGVAVGPVILLCVAIGCVVGIVNAFLVVGLGVNAFIATLGTATVLSGGNLLVTNGAVIFGIQGSLVSVAQRSFAGVPSRVYFLAILAVFLWYALDHTPYGRFLRATGLGREAARLTGVPTSRYLASSFVVAGAVAGFAGVLQTSLVSSATPTVGPDFLLPAYAAAFLGATTIKRGMFNVWGTIVGVFVLAVGITGLQEAGAPFWVSNIFNGAALIVAVSTAAIVDRRRRRLV
jgi:ribose transport system permease protein